MRPQTARAALVTTLLALVVAALAAVPAAAQQGTVTAQACAQGRIRNSAGAPIPQAQCRQLIGRSIQLASTGLDVWLVALAGVGCIGGAVALRRRLPAQS